MGLFACFANPATYQSKQQLLTLTKDLAEARAHVSRLQEKLQQLHTGEAQPQEPAIKKDAATKMPCTSVAVQAKPLVMLESRIPQPGSDEQPSTTAVPQGVGLKSRIPAHPAKSSTNGGTKELGTESLAAGSTGLIRAISTKACQEAQQASPTNLPSPATAAPGHTFVEVAEYEQRIMLLQQQLKVADAFRTSLEAQLRDARFAHTNMQTQLLSLQTKCEKTMEEQVAELEKLSRLRKEGQDRYDAVAAELAELKRLLEDSSAGQLAAYKAEASAAIKRANDSELKLPQVTSQLHTMQEELHNTKAQLHSTEQLVEHMAEKAKSAASHHEDAITRLQDELKRQKAIYDSTVEEMLQLSNTHNRLKRDFHTLQSETRNNGEVVQLVQQELAELSYYAAAGRVALGVAPEVSVRSFSTSEGSSPPHGSTGQL